MFHRDPGPPPSQSLPLPPSLSHSFIRGSLAPSLQHFTLPPTPSLLPPFHFPSTPPPPFQIVGENGTHIFVTLHLSSLPGIATTTTTPKTADEILQLILDETKDGRLPFRVALGSGPAVSPTILRVNEESDSCSDKDVSIGQAAGFAVGMLALGIFLGILLVLAVYFIGRLCCFRRRPAVVSSVKYEKHEDDS